MVLNEMCSHMPQSIFSKQLLFTVFIAGKEAPKWFKQLQVNNGYNVQWSSRTNENSQALFLILTHFRTSPHIH